LGQDDHPLGVFPLPKPIQEPSAFLPPWPLEADQTASGFIALLLTIP
jgi:hypothetical protein